MAFNPSAQRSTDTASNNPNKGYEEAAGFVNITLTLPGQPVVKLPSLALQTSKFESLVVWLNEDPTRITKLAQYLTLDYKANVKTAKVLDFSKIV